MNFTTLQRRVLGLAFVILLVGAGYLGINAVLSAPTGSYKVTAELGTVGSGLYVGADVKFRGVIVGSVSGLSYDGKVARAELTLDPEPAFPDPSQLDVAVAQKTLLGEKQIELRLLVPSAFPARGDVLAGGDVLVAREEITELDDVINRLSPFLDSVETESVATIFETLSAMEGEAEVIRQNLDVGSELAQFGARVADESIDRLQRLGRVGDTLREAADDLDRLALNTPSGTEFIRTRTDELDQLLVDTSTFAITIAEWLEVEEDLFDRLIDSSDPVLDLFERNRDVIGGAVQGLYRYTYSLGHEPGWLTDGSGWAGFKIFIDGNTFVDAICADAGPIGAVIPLCGDVAEGDA